MSYFYGQIGPTAGLSGFPEDANAYNQSKLNTLWTLPPKKADFISLHLNTTQLSQAIRQFQRTYNNHTSSNILMDGRLGPTTLRLLMEETKSAVDPGDDEKVKDALYAWIDADDQNIPIGVTDPNWLHGLFAFKGIKPASLAPMPRPAQAGFGSATLFALAAGLGYLAWRSYDYQKKGKWSWWG